MAIGGVDGDVTARVIRRSALNPHSSEVEAGQPKLEVEVDLVLPNLGTDDDIPAAGIPLTELFSQVAGFEGSDTYLEPAQPVTVYGSIILEGDTAARICKFEQKGSGASDQVLVVYNTTGATLAPETGNLTIGNPGIARVTFRGRMRAQFSAEKL